MVHVELQPGYLLHSRPYSESSLIVNLLTHDYGFVSGVYKGARRKSKNRVPVQLFKQFLVSWSGKSDLKSITHWESSKSIHALQGVCLFAGMYANELLERLLQPGLALPEIYQAYEGLLASLSKGEDMEVTLRHFEFHLLAELGYGFDWYQAADTGKAICDELFYRFDPQHGFLTEGMQSSPSSFAGIDIRKITEGDFAEKFTRQCAKQLARQALAPHLGSKPIKSRELFRSFIS